MKKTKPLSHPNLYSYVTNSVAGAIIGFFILICIPGIISKMCGFNSFLEMKKFGWVLVFWGIELAIIKWFKEDKVTNTPFRDGVREIMPVAYALYKLFRWAIWGVIVAAIYNYWESNIGYDKAIINNILFSFNFLLSAIVVGVAELVYSMIRKDDEQ